MRSALPPVVVSNILQIHDFLGCDTVSRIHGIGKGMESLRKILRSSSMQASLQVFSSADADHDTVAEAGEKLLGQLYGFGTKLSIDSLHAHIFNRKVATATTAVTPESLPPTSNALKFHSYRAYHQTQTWRGEIVDPLVWGYEIRNGKMLPIRQTKEAAPANLLKIVRCSCKKGCKTNSCTCRKHGLHCTNSCKECCGSSCSNSQKADFEEYS